MAQVVKYEHMYKEFDFGFSLYFMPQFLPQ